MILFVGAGALAEALAALRNAQLPETSAMFLLACHEAKATARASLNKPAEDEQESKSNAGTEGWSLDLPGSLNSQTEGVVAVCEYFGQYQRMLAHTVSGLQPVSD
jgi:hypothetical protein